LDNLFGLGGDFAPEKARGGRAKYAY